MDSISDVADELQHLQQQWEGITAVPESPRSTMHVIEYGLGKKNKAEVYINRLLCYLLDPAQPHRMGSEFLEAFLKNLPDTCEFDEDTFDLSDVNVNQQVPVWAEPADTREADATPGYLDLLLEVPNEWFLLIELKFSAEEVGTEFYCTAAQFDDRLVTEYASGQYYLYMHQADQGTASGDCFVNWSWQSFLTDMLDPFIAEHTARYPQRTATQLYDLKDDIKTISDMNDRSSNDQEKVSLYLDHVEAIEDVSSVFDGYWEEYTTEWGEKMTTLLDHDDVRADTDLSEDYSSVIIDRDQNDHERWILFDSGGDWQHLFKYGWRRREHEDELLVHRADDRNDLRIGFYHRMGDGSHRERAVKDREFHFYFRTMGSNPTAFNTKFENCFEQYEGEINECLTGTNAELTGEKLTSIRGAYPIKLDSHSDFFTAYTAALNEAFFELIVDNPDLIHVLDEVFEEAIEQYRSEN